MTRRSHLSVPALAAVLLLAGCGGRNASPSPYSEALGERQQVRVDVLNNNFNDATLWAVVRDARRIRLGTVTGKSEGVFTLPWSFSEPMRIEIDLVAGPRCLTDDISVDPGDVLRLEIKSVLSEMDRCRPY